MAINTDLFFVPLSTAFQQLYQNVRNISRNIQSGTLAYGTSTGVLPNGGYVEMTFTRIDSPSGTSRVRCFASEFTSTLTLPLSVMANSQFVGITTATNANASNQLQADEFCSVLAALWRFHAAGLSGATFTTPQQASFTRSGHSVVAMSAVQTIVINDTDAWPVGI